MGALHSHDNHNHGHVQDFLEKAKKVFEEKWVVNPKVSGFRHQMSSWAFHLCLLQHGFPFLMEIFRGIFCRTLKSECIQFYLYKKSTSSIFTCDFNILQMQQSSKLGMARFSRK